MHTVWVAPESQNDVFCYDEKKAMQFKVIKMEEVKKLRACIFFTHVNVQHAGDGLQ